MLSERLATSKSELLTEVSELWQGLDERIATLMGKEVGRFWTVELWNDVLYMLMGQDFRVFYVGYLRKYGVTKQVDDEEKPLVRKQFDEFLRSGLGGLKQTFLEVLERVAASRQEEADTLVVPHMRCIAETYAQRIVDYAQADYRERHQFQERQFTVRLEQARAQQKQAEQRVNNLLQKMPGRQSESEQGRVRADEMNVLTRVTRQQYETLKVEHQRVVEESTHHFNQVDGLRNKLVEMESLHTKATCQLRAAHRADLAKTAAKGRAAVEQVQAELRQTYTKLDAAVAKQRDAEDISHHLDTLCEKLNLEVNWLLRVVRRSGIDREKVDTIQAQLQNMNFTGATTLPLCVPGGWPEGESPDTAAPIRSRQIQSETRAAPPNVPHYNVLLQQSEALRETLKTEGLRDEIGTLKAAILERDGRLRKMQLLQRHKDRDHESQLRKLYSKYSEQVSTVTQKAHTLQRKLFAHSHKGITGRRHQYSTQALDDLSRKLASKELKLNEANMQIWRLKRVAEHATQQSRTAGVVHEPDPPDVPDASPAEVDFSVLQAELDQETCTVSSMDSVDLGLLMTSEEEAAAAAALVVVLAVVGARVPSIRQVPCEPPPASHRHGVPLDLHKIDTKLWREADTEVQRIADAQLQAAQKAHARKWESASTPHSAPPAYPVKFTTAPFTERMTPRPPSSSSAPSSTPRPTKTSAKRQQLAGAEKAKQARVSSTSPVPDMFHPLAPQKTIVTLPFKEVAPKTDANDWKSALQSVLMDVRVRSKCVRHFLWDGARHQLTLTLPLSRRQGH